MTEHDNVEQPVCPISIDTLPPPLRKYFDAGTRLETRMMAAKGLIPMQAIEQVKALLLLSFDQDEGVRAAAQETASSLPDAVLTPALRSELPRPVLDFLSRHLTKRPPLLELILLNPETPDDTFAFLAPFVEERLLVIVADNQLRMLRHEDIIRGILQNPDASAALRDRVVDFAVRSGVNLTDVPAFAEARRRILGDDVDKPTEPDETAAGILELHAAELEEDRDDEDDLEEEKRQTLEVKIRNMSVSEKIKLATLGNKEARTLLLRDSNKLVQAAAVQSPRISESEVASLTNSKTVPDEILRIIMRNREWMKSYMVKLNLINNPKTPLPAAIRLLPHLRANDLRGLTRNRNVPNVLSVQARNILNKKAGGGKAV